MKLLAIVITASLVSAMNFPAPPWMPPLEPMPFVPHPPIRIDGDDQFTPLNGVVGGNGTEEDPYLISGWLIPGTVAIPIEIQNTRSHAIVSGNLLLLPMYEITSGPDAVASAWGVRIENSTNLTLRENQIEGLGYGIRVQDAADIYILANELRGPSSVPTSVWISIGIYLVNSGSVQIHGNVIEDITFALYVGDASLDAEVSHNEIRRTYEGTSVLHAVNTYIHNNTIIDTRFAYFVRGSENTRIAYNEVRSVHAAFDVDPDSPEGTVQGLRIENNTFSDVGDRSFLFTGGSRSQVRHNVFEQMGGPVQAAQGTILAHNLFRENEVAVEAVGNVTMRQNHFEESHDVYVVTFAIADVRWNWWASPEGPAPGTLIVEQDGRFVLEPWLTEPPADAGPIPLNGE